MSKQILLKPPRIDPSAKRLLEFVFVGSKGGFSRTRIILILKKEPLNANQLAKRIGLDYKTIKHHVEVLEKNNLISHMGDKYGVIFFPSIFLEHNMMIFDELAVKWKTNNVECHGIQKDVKHNCGKDFLEDSKDRCELK
ncbi:MAG TPA: winged helix-turn-helix domain-containing protein [Nitrosopumilaceae archaeon]|nr:winged helix-turn-helix domain-containing protein [Nitrosopumilaceae archaeon]